jgi:hypothetical protein
MPVVLVVIVAVVWMAILGPSIVKRRSRSGGEIGSISHFHQQLRVLEHSAPQPIVAPAYRLRAVDGSDESPDGNTVPVLTVVGADRLPRPALAFLGDDPGDGCDAAPVPVGGDPALHRDHPGDAGRKRVVSGPMTASARAVDPMTRQIVRRRRRDTLGVLAGVFAVTIMIGFVPGAAAAWVVSALVGAALVAYVALLVHLRRMAEEREQKLRYLNPRGVGERTGGGLDAGGVGRMPVAVSGRYAHPSNQAVAAR